VTPHKKLPVWFFIQGGGYAANSDRNFNGSEVVAKSNYSMIFVQINYRVGAFGFLASEKIRENGDLNVGLLDQQKALKWARQNIHLVRPGFLLISVCNKVLSKTLTNLVTVWRRS
jgi:carboxylesterase type B